MPLLAELVDAVVGVDTHRDTHQVEIALPNGAPIAVTTISNDTTGYAELLAWIVDHAPGPRLARVDRGHPQLRHRAGPRRRRGRHGRARVRTTPPQGPPRDAASPTRSTRTWPCWLRCAWTPTGCPPHARTATARRCGSCSVPVRSSPPASTAQTNRLRALLLGRRRHRPPARPRPRSPRPRLSGLARRRPPREASREQAVRHAEIRRLALALREAARELKANRAQLQTIVNDIVPGLTERRGIGPVSAAQAIVSFSHPGRCRNDAAFAALRGASPLPASSGRTVRHRLNRGG